jgi:FkbM family methyltransferase
MNSSSKNFSINYMPVLIGHERHYVPAYAAHRPACARVLKGVYHEPDTHRVVHDIFKLVPGNLIHAGTFFGDMLPSFSRSVGNGRVYAFEPVLENYVLARMTTEANFLSNVILFNAALGDAVGTAQIATVGADGLHRGGSSQIAERGQICTILALDTLAIPDVTLIQLDVEGYELQALRGAQAILANQKPVVMAEDNLRNCEGFMQQVGYEHIGSIPGLQIYLPLDETAPARRIMGRIALSTQASLPDAF